MLGKLFNLVFLVALNSLFSFAQAPDLVIFNADVRTMDKVKPRAEAVAVTGNKFSAVGRNAEIRKLIDSNTKTIDAKGKLVLPGFNDSHVHFFSIGSQFLSLNLKSAGTAAEVMRRIKISADFLPPGTWIIGNFQNQGDFSRQTIPSKEEIDKITLEHPVLLYLQGIEIAFANSLALKIGKIANSSDGILRGSEVYQVKNRIPPISYGTSPLIAEAASNYAASMGVTSVQDVHSDDSFEILRELERQGKLKTRIYECIGLKNWQKLANGGIRRASGEALIRRGCLKFFSDGDKEEIPGLVKLITSADKADLQVMMHAIGEKANDAVLTVFENVVRQNGVKDRRFRIEHAHNFRLEDLRRFTETKTIASMQPALFFDGSGDDSRLFRQMLDAKTALAFGSDANIIDINPLRGIYAAVYGDKLRKGISVEEAVSAYTLGAAYAEFQENVKGSITVGKLADLVILSDNIFTMKPEEIGKVKVVQTIMDGRIIYQAK